MIIETIAALIWRFIGVFVIAGAIPGALVQSLRVIGAIQSPGSAGGPDFVLMTLLSVILIVLGVAIIQQSPKLGRIITRGL